MSRIARHALRPAATDSAEQLADARLDEFATQWRQGQRTTAEQFLAEHQEWATDPQAAVRVVYEEICLREEHGESFDSAEYYRRFPQWRDPLRVVFDCHRLLDDEPAECSFPEPGGQLGDLHLLRELGRGARGRVYLATQPSLSDRALVVKLTPASGNEHLSLARLQHTHIVPLYLIQDFPQEHLRALCMPYLGGSSWSSILQYLRQRAPEHRLGQHLVAQLSAEPDEVAGGAVAVGPAWHFLSRASYTDAVAWIGSCLADALHYAHQRGIVHLDVKPSNVLVAGDGQPMLLDFHLAQEAAAAYEGLVERLGGTRGYMSPEQEQCAQAIVTGRPLPVPLDSRSDIYSLGVLLYESLADRLPSHDEAESRRAMRQANPQVSQGLSDVVHKCLAHDPASRYDDASQLAIDLRRHLAAMPLAGVPNRSPAELWRKWRRRKPYALPLAAASIVMLAVLGVAGLASYAQRAKEGRATLASAEREVATREFSSAISRLETGWPAIRWLPWQDDLKRGFQRQLDVAQQARLADALRSLVDQLRFIDGVDGVPIGNLHALSEGCRQIWDARSRLVTRSAGESAGLANNVQRDLLDLSVLWAKLQVRLAGDGQQQSARNNALALLNEAETAWGSNLALQLAQAEITQNTHELPSALPPAKTTWDHHVLGRFWLANKQFTRAQIELELALAAEPGAFWLNYDLLRCTYQQERFNEALNLAYACVAIAPQRAECYYNRALCQQALRHDELAITDFTKALQLDANLAAAALGRGIVYRQQQDLQQALADIQLAEKLGADRAQVHYQWALTLLADNRPGAAIEQLDEALRYDATYSPATELKRQLADRP